MPNKIEDTDLDVMPYELTEEEAKPLHDRLEKCQEKMNKFRAEHAKKINGNGTKRLVMSDDTEQPNNGASK